MVTVSLHFACRNMQGIRKDQIVPSVSLTAQLDELLFYLQKHIIKTHCVSERWTVGENYPCHLNIQRAFHFSS